MTSELIVVGIGASAGGLDAINELFDNLPADSGMAFVLIQHLSPDFESMMDNLLAKHTKMPIQIVKSDTPVRGDHIYLIDKNSNIIIEDNVLKPSTRSKRSHLNMPIDEFFHSLGVNCKKCGIGIILSGTGTDGSRGIRTLKESDGLIFVQTLDTAHFDGMPRAAIDTGLVDNVLSPKEMAEALVALPKSLLGRDSKTLEMDADSDVEESVSEILREILDKRGTNFMPYRRTTILRRIEKRMLLCHKNELKTYVEFVKKTPKELGILVKEFLIGVTRFFRDIDGFEVLKNLVIPNIFLNKSENETARIWVAGCSSGEEAYSLAIIIEDFLSENNLRHDFKIFASDLDPQAIRHANPGIFASQIAEDVPINYLTRYFEKMTDGRYKILKKIRDRIVFTVHDLLSDPPFINMDMISCRNLLIYVNNDYQRHILQNFQFALKYMGYLFLGPSETLGKVKNSFGTINERWNIFQNQSRAKLQPFSMKRDLPLRTLHAHSAVPMLETQLERPTNRLANDSLIKKLLSHYMPMSLLVDKELNLVYTHGDLSKFFNFPQSPQFFNLEDMTGMEEILLFKNGIQRTQETRKPNIFREIVLRKGEDQFKVDLRFQLFSDPNRLDPIYLVEFLTNHKLADEDGTVVVNKETDLYEEHLRTMELELRRTKDERTHLIERLETMNEELHSSNEELIAANEELQSTNEELQSVNEELHTVNTEMQAKMAELTMLNGDLGNLLRSTDIGTIFVDRKLNIRKFTPAIANQFQLQNQDIGRPITAFVSQLKDVDFHQKMNWVLKHSQPIEEEVETKNGHPYLMRLMPYLLESQVDGVVASFTDISQIKEASIKLRFLAEQFEAIFNSTDNTILVLDPDGNVLDVNKPIEGTTRTELIGKNYFSDILYHKGADAAKKAFDKSIMHQQIASYNSLLPDNTGDVRYYSNQLVPLFENRKINRVLCIIKDETYLQSVKEDIRLKAAIFNSVFQFAKEHIMIMDPEGVILDINYTDGGFTKASLLGKKLVDVSQPTQQALIQEKLTQIMNGGANYAWYETDLWDTQGNQRWYHNILSPVVEDGKIIRIILITRDITDAKKMEIDLKDSNFMLENRLTAGSEVLQKKNQELETINSFMDSFVHGAAHDLRSPLTTIKSFLELLPEVMDAAERETIFEELNAAALRMERVLAGLVELIEFQRKEGPKPKRLQLKAIVENSLEELKPYLEKAEGSIQVNIPDDIEFFYIEAYLQSVVHNLIHNAIKYRSDQRKLEIKVSAANKEDGSTHFKVSDNGIGMDLRRYGHFLFKPFRRLTVQREGTGIGLSIINNVVTKNGGEITVESELEKGSTFNVVLKPYNAEA